MASEGEDSRRFYLQYFFPPSSVGETGRQGAPGRREIGHGALAERALAPIIPDEARPRAPAAQRHCATERAGRPCCFHSAAETLAPAAVLVSSWCRWHGWTAAACAGYPRRLRCVLRACALRACARARALAGRGACAPC
jgi:hypothetical protein